jgi:hypothetical protein
MGGKCGITIFVRLMRIQEIVNNHLVVNDVKNATLKNLMEDKKDGYTALYWASCSCPTEVVEAILDKGVPINQLSKVSYYCVGRFIS